MTRSPAALLAAVAVLVASVVGAVLAPSSWWAAVGLAAFVATMVLLRPRVPERYRAEWPRATIMTSIGAGMGAASYAFAYEPLGPRPGVAIVFGSLLAASAAATVGGSLTWMGHAPSELMQQDEVMDRQRERVRDVRNRRF